jgi:hypothetical protein
MDAARALLAGSKAVRQFRTLAYGLPVADAASPLGAAFQVTATFLSLLDGDVDAARRLAARGRSEPGVGGGAPASKSPAVQFDGSCYDRYVSEIVSAWNDYGACLAGSVWPFTDLCACEWLLRAESSWFGFLSCSAIPMKLQ